MIETTSVVKPKSGDRCGFCSYGGVSCPPIQAGKEGCA